MTGDAAGRPGVPRAFGLTIDPDELLPRERYRFGAELSGEERLVALARGLASSPAWAAMEDAVMVVRTQPPAGLALLGRFSPDEVARVEALPGQLHTELRRFRYIPYGQVEDDCALLGEKLADRFGRTELRSFGYVGMPRGGLVVLGLLSYVLGLRRERLTRPGPAGSPTVVVDDVALTGLRFGEFLRERAGESVVFAHLYSHPDLRTALREREPDLVDVVAARDLTDHAPELMGDGHAAWHERWMRRAEGACYWIGRTEHLCFPWAEPDFALWNPVSEREELGWRVVPPSAALKNRFHEGGAGDRLQVQPHSAGAIRVGERTFHGELGGMVVAADLASGEVVTLPDVAGEIWRIVARTGSLDDVVRSLSASFDADPAVLRADARQVVGDLIRRGFLTGDLDDPGAHAR